jgi:outer membrane protein assembly factor BamB
MITSSPSIDNDLVYIGNNVGFLYAFDVKSGELKCTYKTSWIGYLYAVDGNTDKLKWKYRTGWIDPPETDPYRTDPLPSVFDGIIYAGSQDCHLYALDLESGELKWHLETKNPVTTSPTVINGVVYVVCGDNRLYAVDAESGVLLWKYKVKGVIDSAIVVDDNDVIYFGSRSGLSGLRGWGGYLNALEIKK